jgi:hypothetical protein
MKRTLIIVFVVGLAIGLGGGFLLGNLNSQEKAANNSSEALVDMLPASSLASGFVQEVKDSKIRMDGGWILSVDKDTDIFIRRQKSASEFQAEVKEHARIVATDPSVMAPLPTKDVAVSISDVRQGMAANVELKEALKPGEIAADKILKIVLTEPSAPAATSNTPPPPAP